MPNKECFIFVVVPNIISFPVCDENIRSIETDFYECGNSQLCIVQSTACLMGPLSNSFEALFIQFRRVSSEIVVTFIFH